MKKIYFATGVLLISMCMLLACENKNASQGDSKKAEQAKQATEAPKDAKVATAENGKRTESNDVTVDVQKYHNTEKIVSENDYAISSDLQDMSEEAQEIVEAKIRTFQYVVIDGDAWTKIELDIQSSLSGTLKKGDSITLYQSGGYVPLTDHIAYYKDAFRYKEWSKKKINDTILQETINGEGEPVVGTEAIYYLTKFKKDGILNGNYGRVCGKYAQLNKINDDTYQHEQMSGSNSSEKVTISDIKKELQE